MCNLAHLVDRCEQMAAWSPPQWLVEGGSDLTECDWNWIAWSGGRAGISEAIVAATQRPESLSNSPESVNLDGPAPVLLDTRKSWRIGMYRRY